MFELVSPYEPAGDQPAAIAKLTEGVLSRARHQTLVGVTGSGKTFTMANVIRNVNRPTLVISHNKTLAAQLYAEFKGFFPNNAVEYFVSYFDYYQPEAYLPRTDTYIEKDSSINEEIERLRLSTMNSLFARRDVIVVASVSCIYGIGSKEDYEAMVIPLRIRQESLATTSAAWLICSTTATMSNSAGANSGARRHGGALSGLCGRRDPPGVFGDEIDRLTRFDPLTGQNLESLQAITIYPGKQFVTPMDKIKRAILSIREELGDRIAWFEARSKLLEAQRIRCGPSTIRDDVEMGFCSGIENYSRHLSARARLAALHAFDFFPSDTCW